MRARLKSATHAAHVRVHGHDGFAAAASGAISPEAYRDLLARLYGFHAAFDADMRQAPASLAREIELAARARAGLLAQDLLGLGAAPERIAALPLCTDASPLRSKGDFLGALYVVEGSTLGGTFIARALAPKVGANRRFFLGRSGERGRPWRDFVKRFDRLDAEPAQADDAERSALAAFAAFERWMADWRGAARETPAHV